MPKRVTCEAEHIAGRGKVAGRPASKQLERVRVQGKWLLGGPFVGKKSNCWLGLRPSPMGRPFRQEVEGLSVKPGRKKEDFVP